MKFFIGLLAIPFFVCCQQSPTDYEAFKKSQNYTVPLWTKSYTNAVPVALFIFPHPDDEVVCAGTIAQLKKQGWEVNLLTLTQGNTGEEAVRSKEWEEAVKRLGIDHHTLLQLPNNPWENITKGQLVFWDQQTDSIKNIIYRDIKKYSPTLLFTYDDVLGGYGHPEHRLTAAITKDIFLGHREDSSFSVQAIFQITLAEKLETMILGRLPSYKDAIKTAGKGLPDPTIAFDITADWPEKRNAAMAYTSQAKTLKKFFLVPPADTLLHYNSFDREYYLEIKR
jgi:N-acetylglucosamine malate deacetylase 2